MRWLSKIVEGVSRIINFTGMGMLVVIMLLIAVDVGLRFLLNQAILGAYSFVLVEFLLILVFFFGFAYTAIRDRHIKLDLVVSRISPSARTLVGWGTNLASVVLLSLLVWQVLAHANALWQGKVVAEMLPIMPAYPFALLAAVATVFFCLVLLIDLFGSGARALQEGHWHSWLLLLLIVALVSVLYLAPLWFHERFPGAVSPATTGLIGLGLMFLLLASGMYVALGMALVGFLGMVYLSGANAGLGLLELVPFAISSSYTFVVIPLFILIGEFAFAGQMSRDLFVSMRAWFGRLPGGLAVATIAGCAGFAACSGSSMATAATMGSVALPEMKRYGYDPKLATGCIASGGTLGILIPPSTIFVIYAILTEESVGELFIAGIFPGILLAALFGASIYIRASRNIKLGPPGPSTTFKEKMLGLKSGWAVVILFLLVVGGLYSGVFSVSEAAGVGAFTALLIGLVRRRITWRGFTDALLETGQITSMLILVIISATIFGQFMALSRIPSELADFIIGLNVPSLLIIAGLLIMFILFGCIGECMTMMIVSLPVVLPALQALGIDLIWYGVLMVLMMETGSITPPVGLNVFVVSSIAPDVALGDIFRGIFPFLICIFICVGLLMAFPEIALFLPGVLQ